LLLQVGAPILLVILVIVTFVIVKVNQQRTVVADTPSAPASSALQASLKNIPAATFDAVGTGTGVSAPTTVTGPALMADGKPRVLYIGAEYCPFCAAQRWAVVAALSRFGTFSNLGVAFSGAADSYPNTATLSFHGATYSSSLLSFTGVEESTNIAKANGGYTALDTPTAADAALFAHYNSKGGIPFADFGNKYVWVGSAVQPDVLQGLTQTQIAAGLQDPSSAIAKQVLGAANLMSAALCAITNGQPATVCGSTAVTSQKLPG